MHEDLAEPFPQPLRSSRLIVAAHAGEEVMGCGGLLAKHRDDAAVVVLVAPDERSVERLRTARHLLGTPAYTFLGLPDVHLTDHLERIVTALSTLIARVRPSELYLPYPSGHEDHAVAYEAGLRSTRRPVARDAWSPVSVLVYDPHGADVTEYAADIRWGVGESLEESDIDTKVAAAVAYGSPVARGLKRCAQDVGSARGLSWAEQFAVVRTSAVRDRGLTVSASVSMTAGERR
ncbi:MAG: PIG-L family deacetylase [Aeromicrobium sp.]